MKIASHGSRRTRLALLVAILSASAAAQEPAAPADEDPHARMRELIAKIERSLGSVDRHLSGIEAAPLAGVESGIARRLSAARESSRLALEQIDQLLELRHHPHPGSGGT